MKIIIAGSRGIDRRAGWGAVCRAMWDAGYRSEIHFGGTRDGEAERAALPDDKLVTEIVSGGATGVDMIGIDWAAVNWVPWREFHPDWATYGKAAGPIRNEAMADYADALVAVWDGKSRGTAHMIGAMERRGKPVYVHRI